MISRFVRFALVGAVATGLQYAILIVLVRVRGMSAPLASSVGFALAVSANYLLNYRYTFRSNRSHRQAALKFAVLASVGLLINAGLMRLMVGAGWNYLFAQVCATALVMLWNFFGNSLWTFRARATA